MRTLNCTFHYSANGSEIRTAEFELDGSQDENEIKSSIAQSEDERAEEERGEDEQGQHYTAEMIVLTEVECDEDIDGNDTLENIFDFAAAYCECDQEPEVVSAAMYLGIQGSDIDEAYQGEYKSDEDFAQETAEQLGEIDRDAKWPHNCIDWEFAAKELMYDYCEHNGHYFRNF